MWLCTIGVACVAGGGVRFAAKSVDWDSCWEFVVASALFKLLDSFNGMFELEILELGASATLTNEFSTSTVSFHCTF